MSGSEKPRNSGPAFAFRMPQDLHDRVKERAGGKEGMAAYCRDVLAAACGVTAGGAAEVDAGERREPGYDEGFRAGWASANATFRKALRAALDELGSDDGDD